MRKTWRQITACFLAILVLFASMPNITFAEDDVPAPESILITGRLASESGSPAGGMTVEVKVGGGVVANGVSDASGAFAVRIAPVENAVLEISGTKQFAAYTTEISALDNTDLGTIVLTSVEAPEPIEESEPASEAEPSEEPSIEQDPEIEYVSVSGRVLDAEGLPLSGITVTASADGVDGNSATTDEEGDFSVLAGKDKETLIRIEETERYTRFEKTVTPEDNLDLGDITLDFVMAQVTGRIVNEKGEPVSGAVGTYSDGGSEEQSLSTNEDGCFTFSVIRGSDVKVQVLETNDCIGCTKEVHAAGDTDIGDLVLQFKRINVTGILMNKYAGPLEGLTVVASADGLEDITSVSEEDGEFSISVWKDRDVRLHVTGSDLYVEYITTVKSAEDVDLGEIMLDHIRVLVTGVLIDEDDNPVQGMVVHAKAEGMEDAEYETNEDGTFEFTLLKDVDAEIWTDATDVFLDASVHVCPGSDIDIGALALSYNRVTLTVSAELCLLELSVSNADNFVETVENETKMFGIRKHSAVSVGIVPMNGCTISTILVNGEPVEEISIPSLEEDQNTIHVVCKDVTAPVIKNEGVTDEENWAKQKTVTVSAMDNIPGEIKLYVAYGDDTPDDRIPETAEEIVDNSFVVTQNGSYRIYAQDIAGNIGTMSLTISKIDREAPVISEFEVDTENWAQSRTYSFTVTDNGELSSVIWNGEELTPVDGVYTFTTEENGKNTVVATDAAGNTSTVETEEERIDKEAPGITMVQTQQTWDMNRNMVTVIAEDNTGIVKCWYEDQTGEKFAFELDGSGKGVIYISENGTYAVFVQDEAGNTTNSFFTIDHVDTQNPEIVTAVKEPELTWTNTEVTITVQATDKQSGVSAIYWTTDPEAAFNTEWDHKAVDDEGRIVIPILNDNDKSLIYRIVALDNVGRFSEEKTVAVNIDISSPTKFTMSYSLEKNSGIFQIMEDLFDYHLLYKDYLTFTISAEDVGSGIRNFEYQLVEQGASVNTEQDSWINAGAGQNGSVTVKLENKADFKGYIYARVYDNCGNGTQYVTDLSKGKAFMVVLENTPKTYEERTSPPVVDVFYPDGTKYDSKWTNQNITIRAYSQGAISGTSRYQYCFVPLGESLNDNTVWTDLEKSKDGFGRIEITSDYAGEVYFRTMSYAENKSKHTASALICVQKTLPANATVSVSGKKGNNEWYVGLPTVAITTPVPAKLAAPIYTYYELSPEGAIGARTLFDGTNSPRIAGDGKYKLVVYTYDAAGNRSAETYSATICVDTTAPTGLRIDSDKSLLAKDQSAVVFDLYYNKPIHVTMGGNANVSGLASIKYQKVRDASAYNPESEWLDYPSAGLNYSPDEHFVLYLRVEDMAGNVSIAHTDGIVLDQTAPTGDKAPEFSMTTIGANKNGWFPGDAQVEIRAIDPIVNETASGIQSIKYTVTTDGKVTQEELIDYGKNGEHITSAPGGNRNTWTGRIQIRAAENNSDNIVLTVTVTDIAGNSRTSSSPLGLIKIDTTAPVVILSYDNNTADTSYHDGPFFDAGRTLTVTVTERNVAENLVTLTITRNGEPQKVSLKWSQQPGSKVNGDDTKWIATVPLTEDGRYKVSAASVDLAGNEASMIAFAPGTLAGSDFVIDKTAPEIRVGYDNNDVVNGVFFQSQRTATVTIKDDNFDASRMSVSITATRDGEVIEKPVISSITRTGDVYVFTIAYVNDGDYAFDISCTDKAGNKAGTVKYGDGKAPTEFTIDTAPVAVVVSGFENGVAYTNDLSGSLTFEDINYTEGEIRLYKTWLDHVHENVTAKYLSESNVEAQSGKYVFGTFPEEKEHDGIYELEYKFSDKAGHTTEGKLTFTVNRFGSVYVYSDDLIDIMNGFHQKVDGNITITEYNPSRLVGGTTNLIITRDGTILPVSNWNVVPEASSKTPAGDRGWYTYVYTISPENFKADGKYTITASSEDEAGNVSQNTEDLSISFWVDTTPPELTNVVGLEEAVVNADSLDVASTFFDAIGLKSLTVTVNGKVVTAWEFDGAELQQELVQHTVLTEGLHQNLTFAAEDLAGNKFSSEDESFKPTYAFNKDVTVSKNLLVRLWANPLLFFGLIGGILLAGGGTAIGIIAAKKKRRKPEMTEHKK